jgi:hypothetical protein
MVGLRQALPLVGGTEPRIRIRDELRNRRKETTDKLGDTASPHERLDPPPASRPAAENRGQILDESVLGPVPGKPDLRHGVCLFARHALQMGWM